MPNPGSDNYQATRDQNRVPVATGVSNTDATQTLPFKIDSVTGRLLIDSGGSASTSVYNEVVSGTNTAWTLANIPTTGTVQLFANGQLLTPTVDYSIASATITTVLSWTSGTVVAFYTY